jgi:ribose-phosphate pyrophosphokinase
MAVVVFSTRSYGYFAADLCRLGGFAGGEIEVKSFPDGERYQRVVTPVEDRSVVLVGGTISDADTLELYDLACAIVKFGARRLTLVIPYFGYSTMERATKWGEVVTAKTRARLLSAIPLAHSGNRVLLLDLHSEGIPYYFEGGLTPTHVYGKPLILEAARELGGEDFVIASTDAGRAKWVESLANDLRVPAAFVLKRRVSGSETRLTAVSAAVEGKAVIIYDDMIRTGGSLIQAARAYREAGAKSLYAVTTHGLFPAESLAKIRAAGLFERVVATDSHPRARELRSEFLTVLSGASLFTSHLRD